ncbi:survival of motor neuron-related-splicing factor 30 [Caerostris darwini]|uniref:Survival of motor neuron-related-splicing factor 30 n=2 Tax=Caerostris TaxID=172845 RepID=A0AAV4P8M8_9ARAC|nr:survival of motor neuron-related-splicing factor 30 [Caerostris extrusa]GIX93782.1 survival of motor neuron-related-splicing factor 30 [Caerostris darwini]
MADDLQSYEVQLQQVEAALTNEPDNEELIALKKNLEEVIQLTTQLIDNNTEKNSGSFAEGSSKDSGSGSWKAGERCLAPWSEDGQFYEAVIDDITEDGQCTVTFSAYGNTDTCDVEQLRIVDKNHKEHADGATKSKKLIIQAQKDYKKKKAQKKAQRMKLLEEEREKEKSKWHNFNSKAFNKKGHVKKSIFASPDNINGRVGIGTCGIGGRPMTEFQQQEKWRRGPGSGPGMLGNIQKGAVIRGNPSAR